jgi:hypothetical protein
VRLADNSDKDFDPNEGTNIEEDENIDEEKAKQEEQAVPDEIGRRPQWFIYKAKVTQIQAIITFLFSVKQVSLSAFMERTCSIRKQGITSNSIL